LPKPYDVFKTRYKSREETYDWEEEFHAELAYSWSLILTYLYEGSTMTYKENHIRIPYI